MPEGGGTRGDVAGRLALAGLWQGAVLGGGLSGLAGLALVADPPPWTVSWALLDAWGLLGEAAYVMVWALGLGALVGAGVGVLAGLAAGCALALGDPTSPRVAASAGGAALGSLGVPAVLVGGGTVLALGDWSTLAALAVLPVVLAIRREQQRSAAHRRREAPTPYRRPRA